MQLKNPGGDLVWLTPLLALGGLFLAYSSFRDGSPTLAILFGFLGLCSLLVWFDLKLAAVPLMIYFSFAIVAGVIALFASEFSWLLVGRLVFAGFTIYELGKWWAGIGDHRMSQG